MTLKPNTAASFSKTFVGNRPFNEEQALIADWESVDFLFQLTDEEIRTQGQRLLFESQGQWDGKIIESYLFFAIALKRPTYTRTELAGITRAVNRLFDMPAMLLFKHGDTLTLSVINRRLHKREPDKDVLEKVTLIRDISLVGTHRAHIEILADLSLMELHGKHGFTIFVTLDAAWRKTLDTSALNKRFFQEIANWYFWALDHVQFPKDAPKADDGKDHISAIRLITRLIFCWFVKEKGLIPDALFDERKLAVTLDGFAPDDSRDKSSIFYRGILQNLFFATLNTEMDKRGWAKDEQNFMAHSVYRFRDCFRKPDSALALFKNIPFLNGGLFECLDKDLGEKAKPRYIRVDGFSRRADSQPVVPDFLFFGSEREVDLSAAYGEARYRRAKVRGLLQIFDHYKFTITENTPIEEEIALDPELSGKVFENLLAAYNPETGATARKQTGSFYTPREIVEYMVDESLIAYLKTKLDAAAPDGGNNESRLRHLFAYTDEPHQFAPPEVELLIDAIDHLKTLDPAVGSGAFPMGILHKLVFILTKLDPNNEHWREVQRQRALRETEDAFKSGDKEERGRRLADINEVFEQNSSDYGRKLYLIENCIYGVDIQPIAVQIAKMRFFISLIVDQKIDDHLDNRGVRPLPNLETKFVAANTLIGLKRPGQQLLRDQQIKARIDAKEGELRRVRERHFLAKTLRDKRKCREQDAKLRTEIAELLTEDDWDSATAIKLATWDPYDQNASADFFDMEWMFGIVDGFDVVVGNPPYVSALDFARIYGPQLREQLNPRYESATGAYDLFVLFVEQGLRSCKKLGHLSFITPNKYLAAKYGIGLRGWLLKTASLQRILDASPIPVFEEAAVYPVVSLFCKDEGKTPMVVVSLPNTRSLDHFAIEYYTTTAVPAEWLRMLPENIWGFLLSKYVQLLPKVTKDAKPLARLGEVNATSTAAEADEYGEFLTSSRSRDGLKVINTGTIDPYTALWGLCEMTHAGRKYLTPYLPVSKAGVNERRLRMYRSPKVVFAKLAKTCEAVIDADGEFASINTNCFYRPQPDISLKYIGGVCNSRMFMFLYDLFFGALRMSGGYYQFQSPQLRVIPIANADRQQQKVIEGLVDAILDAKAKNRDADTTEFEREIDQQVYALYGLTPEEIRIVEEASR